MHIPDRVKQYLYETAQEGHNIKAHINCSPYECRGMALAQEIEPGGIPVVGAIYDENEVVEATFTFPTKEDRYMKLAENVHEYERLFARTRNNIDGHYWYVLVTDSLPDKYLPHLTLRYDPDAEMEWHRLSYDIATQETTKLPIR